MKRFNFSIEVWNGSNKKRKNIIINYLCRYTISDV